MMLQSFAIGMFLDAQQQLQVQRLLQELKAQAHKDFHPSTQMCKIATNIKSLAAAEQVGKENAKYLDALLYRREHLNANQASAGGITFDVNHRMARFREFYCDRNEANRGVVSWPGPLTPSMCDNRNNPRNRRTKDIDYARLVDQPYTINGNFTDVAGAPIDERDILALGQNLYGGIVTDFIPEQMLNEAIGMGLYLDMRSIHAIRSVARHSFTKIVGMKMEGDQNSFYLVKPFLENVIGELGVSNAPLPPPDNALTEIEGFMGENTSYYAQMEVLTRKIYQSPEFYTNLYDKPANVRRTGVSLQAIELMQDRDRFESSLRREMLISLILELKLRKYQEDMNATVYTGTSDFDADADF